jgi:hypothetical protein
MSANIYIALAKITYCIIWKKIPFTPNEKKTSLGFAAWESCIQ